MCAIWDIHDRIYPCQCGFSDVSFPHSCHEEREIIEKKEIITKLLEKMPLDKLERILMEGE